MTAVQRSQQTVKPRPAHMPSKSHQEDQSCRLCDIPTSCAEQAHSQVIGAGAATPPVPVPRNKVEPFGRLVVPTTVPAALAGPGHRPRYPLAVRAPRRAREVLGLVWDPIAESPHRRVRWLEAVSRPVGPLGSPAGLPLAGGGVRA